MTESTPNDFNVKATRKPKNPYRAETIDGLNVAYGKSRNEAIENLQKAIIERERNKE